MLPNSTERTVTVSGSREAVVQAIYQICSIMSEVQVGHFKTVFFILKVFSFMIYVKFCFIIFSQCLIIQTLLLVTFKFLKLTQVGSNESNLPR